MHPEINAIKCSIVRGGTSKGVIIEEENLPKDKALRDKTILAIFGSPDIRQIDGLGGGDVLTSKLAIVKKSSSQDADIDYTFAQVGLEKATVSYKGNCGNIAAAIGPYAINTGIIKAKEPFTHVRIKMTNTDNILYSRIPVKNGYACVEGDLEIDGVPGSGAKIILDWKDTKGAFTGKLLPSGQVRDQVDLDGKSYSISILDLGNPLVFVKAKDLGLLGTETPFQIETNHELMSLIEKIRGKAAEMIGLVKEADKAVLESPYVPFVAIVSEKNSYHTYNGKEVDRDEIDLVSRIVFMQKSHKTYPVTSTVSTGIAAKIPGTVVYDVVNSEIENKEKVVIGHPAGTIVSETSLNLNGNDIDIVKGSMYRTARILMDGQVYVKKNL